ncbi:MAG TPA: NifU family protein [Thermoanaerobaculia bacterium]|nr:NifU family protein [Thermoanaerobaculia bacterium]
MTDDVEDPARSARSDSVVERVQELISRVERIEDPLAREVASDLAAAMLDLYGEGLGRIFAALDAGGPAGAAIRDRLVADGVVGSLLLIHDLYPVPLEERVHEALEKVRPYMESHGGNVEVLSLEGGIARLRLHGSCHGCPSSAATLELAIKQALAETAPDLLDIEVEGVVDPPVPGASASPMPSPDSRLPILPSSDATGAAVANGAFKKPSWISLDGFSDLTAGHLRAVEVEGTSLLVANVAGTLLAYLNSCGGCRATLDGGQLSGGILTCPSCRERFDLPRAGRAIGEDQTRLGPIPLLPEAGGRLRVALSV